MYHHHKNMRYIIIYIYEAELYYLAIAIPCWGEITADNFKPKFPIFKWSQLLCTKNMLDGLKFPCTIFSWWIYFRPLRICTKKIYSPDIWLCIRSYNKENLIEELQSLAFSPPFFFSILLQPSFKCFLFAELFLNEQKCWTFAIICLQGMNRWMLSRWWGINIITNMQ